MIFVSVGSQLSFDRLIRAVDTWAAVHPDVEVIAQIGETSLRPVAMHWSPLLSPADYRERFGRAELVISHAGMGTVITAAECGKRLVIMPRRADLREARNEHQSATTRWLATRPGIWVARNEEEIGSVIDVARAVGTGPSMVAGPDGRLIDVLAAFFKA